MLVVSSFMQHSDFTTFQPFYGGKINKITSEVRNPGGEIVCKVVGEWNGALEYTYANVSVSYLCSIKYDMVIASCIMLSVQNNNAQNAQCFFTVVILVCMCWSIGQFCLMLLLSNSNSTYLRLK